MENNPKKKVITGAILFVVGLVIKLIKLPDTDGLFYIINQISGAMVVVGAVMAGTAYAKSRRP